MLRRHGYGLTNVLFVSRECDVVNQSPDVARGGRGREDGPGRRLTLDDAVLIIARRIDEIDARLERVRALQDERLRLVAVLELLRAADA